MSPRCQIQEELLGLTVDIRMGDGGYFSVGQSLVVGVGDNAAVRKFTPSDPDC